MQIKLRELSLRNFKGIKELSIKCQDDLRIYGDNGTGKTTVVDGFTWLLFDKDSNNKSDFNIKTLDKDNNPIHMLEHEVEGVFEIDGQPLILKKCYKEKWVKARRQQDRVLAGHTTDYWVDEVPCKKKEYVAKVSEIINENIFKLITNPLYFNEQVKWQDRRKLLMEMIGTIDMDQIINMNRELSNLKNILKGKSVDDYKKIVNEKKKKLKEQVGKIPVRIDEVYKGLPSVQDINFEKLELDKAMLQGELDAIEDVILQSQKRDKQYTNLTNELHRVELEIAIRGNQLDAENRADLEELKENKFRLESELRDLTRELPIKLEGLEKDKQTKEISLVNKKEYCLAVQDDTDRTEVKITELEAENVVLRNKWNEINGKEFSLEEELFICPTCKQPLPEADKETKTKELLDNYNADKHKQLEEIQAKGKRNAKQIETFQNDIKEFKKNITETLKNIEELKRQVEEIDNLIMIEETNVKDEKALAPVKERLQEVVEKIENYQEKTIDYSRDKIYSDLTDRKVALEKEIDTFLNTDISKDQERKKIINEQIADINKQLTNKEFVEKAHGRINDLKEEERELSDQLIELEGHEFALEEYIRTKVKIVQSKLDNIFSFVNFKMFNNLVNGGLEECCVAMVNGVPYADLNSASKINAGLDIINALIKYYDVAAPIFIDNRESITKPVKVDTQTISLYVSEIDKLLRIENN